LYYEELRFCTVQLREHFGDVWIDEKSVGKVTKKW